MSNDFKYQSAVVMRLLYNIAQAKGITQAEIAEKTGLDRANVSRIFSGRYSPSLNNVLKIADAIGVFLTFEDRDGKTDLAEALKKAWHEHRQG